jgi:transcriptional regulator with XRE-family HTH domain
MLTVCDTLAGVDDELKATIAARLDALLDENKDSGAGIAKRLGYSRQWINNLRKGRNFPKTADLPGICQALNVTADELLGLKPPARPRRTAPRTPVGPDEYIRFRLRCPHCKNVIEETKVNGKPDSHRRGRK